MPDWSFCDLIIIENINNAFENDYLSTITSNINPLAAEDDIFISALNNNIYDVNKDTTRIILVDLEREYGNYFNKQRPDNLNDKNSKGLYYWTLEHIMPQTIKQGSIWEKNLIEKYGVKEKDQLFLDNVHKLGNLTLTGYNTELSNNEFVDKRDYKDPKIGTFEGLRTPLFLNESIANIKLNQSINEKDSWTIDDINRRNEDLINKVVEIYTLD